MKRKTYVGYTTNMHRRLQEHNEGRSTFTKSFLPWEVIYTERYTSLAEAIKREKYLKSHSGRNKILKTLFQ